jgi:hypothetical protein
VSIRRVVDDTDIEQVFSCVVDAIQFMAREYNDDSKDNKGNESGNKKTKKQPNKINVMVRPEKIHVKKWLFFNYQSLQPICTVN